MSRVIIIGHGFSSRLGMIRTFGKMGCEVDVVVIAAPSRFGRYQMPIDCRSKYVRKVFFSPSGNREGLIDLLLKNCVAQDEKPVLIPDSDFAASTIDLYQERLQDKFLFPHIDHMPGRIVHWMNKLNQKALAREVGLNVASGQVIHISDGRFTIPDSVKYPCFPKPLASAYGGKRGLKKCKDEKELSALLSSFNVKNIDVLVEEYIEIDKEYAVVGFANQSHVIIPAVIVLSQKGNGGHVGVAKIGELIPVAGFESLLSRFEVFVEKVGLTGLFDIDFYESNGVSYFGEMNMRYGASGYALFKNGINLPGMLLEELQGRKGMPMCMQTFKGHATFMNERVCIDDWISGKMSLIQLRRELKERERGFVYDLEDPKPYLHMKRTILQSIPKREVLKVIRGK